MIRSRVQRSLQRAATTRLFSSSSAPKPSKSIVKQTPTPPPPTKSFLLPLAKSLACLLAAGTIIRYARPLTILVAQPIVISSISYTALTFALRRYGKFSWLTSLSFASGAVLLGGGAFALNIASPKSASKRLTNEKEVALLSEAVLLIEAECGSPVRASKDGGRRVRAQEVLEAGEKTSNRDSDGTLKTNQSGESTLTRSIPVSHMYVNGRLHKGTAAVVMTYSGAIFPEWRIESVSVDVEVGEERGNVVVQIYPNPYYLKDGSGSSHDKRPSMFLANKLSLAGEHK